MDKKLYYGSLVYEEKPTKDYYNGTTYISDGIRRWYFDITTKEQYNSSTSTTEHYVENGFAIQDHRTHDAITYTLSGLVGEQVHQYAGEPLSDMYLAQARAEDTWRKLQTLGQCMPTLSNYVYSAINIGTFIYNRGVQVVNTFNTCKSLFNSAKNFLNRKKFGSVPTQVNRTFASISTEKQAQIVQELEKLRVQNTLLVLRCPYGYLENMMIETVEASQTNTWSTSDITITLRQIRTARIADKTKVTSTSTDYVIQTVSLVNRGELKMVLVEENPQVITQTEVLSI